MSSKSEGSIYRVKLRHLGQIKIYASLECLSPVESKFLLGLLELCSTAENTADPETKSIDVTRTQLQDWLKEKDIGCGITIMKKRSAALADIGLFKKEKYQRPKCKPADLFELQDATDVINVPAKESEFADHRPHRQKLNDIKALLVEGDAQILDSSLPVRLARSERLWNGVFGSCMRVSRTDPRRKKSFSTTYRFGKDKIKIITSTQSDSEICHVDDQRTIRNIITLVCVLIAEQKELGKEVKNEFFVDIVDLLGLMGLDGSGANRDTIRDSMKRLYSTNFNVIIDADSEVGSQFAMQFGLTPGADDLNFRFLTELDSSIDREYGGRGIRRPRWYRIALHSKTFADLVDSDVRSTFIDNKEILKASSGLIHIFYSWCSRHIKRAGKIRATITLPELKNTIIPAASYENFRDRLIPALRRHHEKSGHRWVDGATNKINIFGYIAEVSEDMSYDYTFEVYRDKSDEIIGDKSIHARLVAQKQEKEKMQPQFDFESDNA